MSGEDYFRHGFRDFDDEEFSYIERGDGLFQLVRGSAAEVAGMSFPVQCTKCGRVYDLGTVKVISRYTDCSVWKCPGCQCMVDDRPAGWGDHHYVELDSAGFPKRPR